MPKLAASEHYVALRNQENAPTGTNKK